MASQDGVDGGGRLLTLLLGGVGDAPPDATAWEEQRPGPAQKRVVNTMEYAGCARCGGHGEQGMRKGSTWDERMSDVSLEEGELRTSGSESEWWERQGWGVSNPVRKSLQVSHAGRRPTGVSQERIRGDGRKFDSFYACPKKQLHSK
ncbi:hypothetical protein NDU88_002175 [Pleurodeles waltl]|uniref:Uncharacterized protein n=1 Tax=Pleurodeles waltl TaxID=8319 RepID=A0AAV7Q5Z0_PLEWA|nr:hypothetical protein NDU88_002175 [Pleurodeles waltl]